MNATVDMTDDVGWARLGLVQDLRTLRDADQVRWHDGRVQVRPDLLELFRYALTPRPDMTTTTTVTQLVDELHREEPNP